MSFDLPTIAVIGGAGKQGTGLSLRWAKAGYKIIIGSRQSERAKAAAEQINQRLNIKSVEGLDNLEAASKANICVLTVIQTAHQSALESIKDVMIGKILIDATSRVDYRDPKPPYPPSAAQLAQNILDKSMKIAAAFQNVPARLLSKDLENNIDADVLVCSDDLSAAQAALNLAVAAGMRGFYAGMLENAIVVEGLTSILVSMNKHYRVKDASVRIAGINATYLQDNK